MGRLTPDEKLHHLAEAETSLNDTCTLRQSTGITTDSYGETTHTYTDIEDVPCGISYFATRGFISYKSEVGQAVVLEADALLRLLLTQPLSVDDLVIARGKRYTVDGVYDGSTVRFGILKSLETSENGS